MILELKDPLTVLSQDQNMIDNDPHSTSYTYTRVKTRDFDLSVLQRALQISNELSEMGRAAIASVQCRLRIPSPLETVSSRVLKKQVANDNLMKFLQSY